ncbi:uncharacterized protein A4U43_C02F20220 [Asparagus officinalis]|uniref:Uncharacterized protein n=1 Tax=Asparagus officinalis TaxID=4686 RepID=A0A5P1FPG0_ASPOF|nr:uncharacterized protein A4U43_C02F20220 [Asparagus officinalis]
MARKKSSAISTKPRESESPRDLSPDNKKMDNLKTLNQLLIQETTEKRVRIDQLKAQIEDVEESRPFVSDLEREVRRIVIVSALADAAGKARALQERLGLLSGEREGMKKELESVASERGLLKEEVELRKSEAGGFEAKVRVLEKENVEIREKLGEMEASKSFRYQNECDL